MLRKILPVLGFIIGLLVLVALAYDGSRGFAPPPEKRFEKTQAAMNSLRVEKWRDAQRGLWQRLAEDFWDIYQREPNWSNRTAALFHSAEALGELAARTSSAQDHKAAALRYELLAQKHPKSDLADDALFRAAAARALVLNDMGGAFRLLRQIRTQYPKGDMAANAAELEKTLQSLAAAEADAQKARPERKAAARNVVEAARQKTWALLAAILPPREDAPQKVDRGSSGLSAAGREAERKITEAREAADAARRDADKIIAEARAEAEAVKLEADRKISAAMAEAARVFSSRNGSGEADAEKKRTAEQEAEKTIAAATAAAGAARQEASRKSQEAAELAETLMRNAESKIAAAIAEAEKKSAAAMEAAEAAKREAANKSAAAQEEAEAIRQEAARERDEVRVLMNHARQEAEREKAAALAALETSLRSAAQEAERERDEARALMNAIRQEAEKEKTRALTAQEEALRAAMQETERQRDEAKAQAEIARRDAERAKQHASSGKAEVTQVSWTPLGSNALRISVELDRHAAWQVHLREGVSSGRSPRLTLEISGAVPGAHVPSALRVRNSLLTRMMVRPKAEDGVALVFDFASALRYDAQVEQNPFRIVLTVLAGDAAPPRGVRPRDGFAENRLPGPEGTRVSEQKVAALRAAQTRRFAQGGAAGAEGGSSPSRPPQSTDVPVEAMLDQLGLSVVRTVFIDPGHGGKDPGTEHNGIVERDLVLDIGLRLGRLLEARGLKVAYSRTTDVAVPLSARAQKANQARADLFLSIHVNAHSDSAVQGLETFYLDFARNPQAARVATLENLASDRTLGDMQSLLADVMLTARTQESSRLAADVHNTMLHRLGRQHSPHDGGIRAAPFHVLMGARMPAVLVEVGYCTNEREARLLGTPAYRQTLAEGLAEGIMAYRVRLQSKGSTATPPQ